MKRKTDVLDELRNRRVALVLMGGGAKGAYQVGVWKALWELGIRRFCTIAGTSVGALNAVLFAQSGPVTAEKVWESIVKAGVLETPESRWNRVALWCLGYSLIFLPVIVAAPVAVYIDFATAESWFRSTLAGSLIVSMGIYLRLHSLLLKRAAKKGVMIPFFLLNIERYDTIGDRVWQLGLLNVVIAAFQAKSVYDTTWAYCGMLLGYPLSYACLQLGMQLLKKTLQRTPLFARERLTDVIEEIGANHEFPHCEGPVWATVAKYSVYHNPFVANPFDYELRYRGSRYKARDWRRSAPITDWTPFYVDVTHESDCFWVLKATSAIPFAFQSVQHYEQVFVDGGVCDNRPITPVLESSPDYVIVVGVNNEDRLPGDEQLHETLERLWQLNHFSNASREEVDRVRAEWVGSVPDSLRSIDLELNSGLGRYLNISQPIMPTTPAIGPKLRAKVLLLKPSEPIASRLPLLQWTSGTLNFSPEYVSRLIKLGYEDTKRRFNGTIGEAGARGGP